MASEIRTYLVGRRNITVPCDIALPETERSVSRKHLELTVTSDGRCYLVHLHPENTTKVLEAGGGWVRITQQYVDWDAPLLLGHYQTTARQLLTWLPQAPQAGSSAPEPKQGKIEWDPDRGSFVSR
jgi:hypothetical protein